VRWDPLLAVEFLTIARLRPFRPVAAEALAGSQAFYPLVGLGIGTLLVLVDRLLRDTLPAGAMAAVLVAMLAVVTRGLHLDGLADTFDGLLGGHDAAQRLEIMRDPRIGSFGAVSLIVLILLKWSAIAALTAPVRVPALLLAPTLARYAMVVLAAAIPYARPQGLGAGYRAAARGAPVVLATASAAVAAVVLFRLSGVTLISVATLIALGIGSWAWRGIGGVTGDVYGAACEVTETGVLLVIVAASAHGWTEPGLVRG
jgi:adenosylcobinamide-GDP ribazoletransferase